MQMLKDANNYEIWYSMTFSRFSFHLSTGHMRPINASKSKNVKHIPLSTKFGRNCTPNAWKWPFQFVRFFITIFSVQIKCVGSLFGLFIS